MPNKKYYIAYGSNLNVDQMLYRCPGAGIAGIAELKDWHLLFRGSKTGAYLTIEEAPGKIVPVAVWEVTKADEKRLDVYEGFPTFYYKKELQISLECISTGEVKEVTAFVYIMHEDRPYGVPSAYYVDICAEGYDDFGFDKGILAEAYHNSREKRDEA